ncbi:MAG: IS982 family transposase [Thermomicrobiales bacterium]
MLDPETFLTEWSVVVEEFCKVHARRVSPPGPAGGLTTSEVVTLAISAQQTRFPSERVFHRRTSRHLRARFPGLPGRDRFNRLTRAAGATITTCALHVGQTLATGDDQAFEVIADTGLVVRNAKRRGAGWLFGQAEIGWWTRIGWYEGMRLLVSVTPSGAVTGWGFGPASTNDRVLAETCFAARATPHPRLPSVGAPTSDRSVADMGCSGQRGQARWASAYGAVVVSPPQADSTRAWPKPRRTWLASIRQVIEAVHDRLLVRRGLDRERPHALDGVHARLAAAIGLHNGSCWLNRRFGRAPLQTADLIDW